MKTETFINLTLAATGIALMITGGMFLHASLGNIRDANKPRIGVTLMGVGAVITMFAGRF